MILLKLQYQAIKALNHLSTGPRKHSFQVIQSQENMLTLKRPGEQQFETKIFYYFKMEHVR